VNCSSKSTNGMPSLLAKARPMVVLPAPPGPMSRIMTPLFRSLHCFVCPRSGLSGLCNGVRRAKLQFVQLISRQGDRRKLPICTPDPLHYKEHKDSRRDGFQRFLVFARFVLSLCTSCLCVDEYIRCLVGSAINTKTR